MSRSRVNLGDQELAYLSSPGTGRPVILVHGNSSSADTWTRVLDGPLGQRFRCLALDLPGHGESAPAPSQSAYSLPGYASVLADFADSLAAADAVFVGWSLGGHIVLEAAPSLPGAAGFVIFGTPPTGNAAQMAEAFLPNPAMNIGFSPEVSEDEARAYAASFTAPGSRLPLDDFVADIARTDGAARAGLLASIGAGDFTDETRIVAELDRPLAILHGAGEQLVNLAFIEGLPMPTLWRGRVQVIPDAGHAAHQEAPAAFTDLLERFIADVG